MRKATAALGEALQRLARQRFEGLARSECDCIDRIKSLLQTYKVQVAHIMAYTVLSRGFRQTPPRSTWKSRTRAYRLFRSTQRFGVVSASKPPTVTSASRPISSLTATPLPTSSRQPSREHDKLHPTSFGFQKTRRSGH